MRLIHEAPEPFVQGPPAIDDGPLSWIQQAPLRNWLMLRGLKLLAISLALACTLAALAVLAISAGLAQALSTISAGANLPVSSSQGPTTDQLLAVFLVILGFFFFTANLAPYGLDVSVVSWSAFGIGSLLITSIIVILAYRSGRQSQRLFPSSRSNFESAARAAFMVVPYWIGSLILFLTSSLHVQIPFVGNLNLGPSPIGLLTPLLLVGGSAAAGAVRQRGQLRSASSIYAVRGVVLALFSIAIGIVGTLVGAVVLVVVSQASQSSAIPTAPISSSSGAQTPAAPSSNALGAAVVVLGILAAIFFIPNGLFWLWGNAIGLNLGSGGWVILAFAAAGALIGALAVRPRPGGTEQISYAVTFGLASFVLAFVSRPTIGAYLWGGNPWTVLVFGLVLGAILAIAGPYVAMTGLGRTALALPLLQFALTRLPMPQLQPLTAPQPTNVAPQPMPTAIYPQINLPTFHFGRRARMATGALVVLVITAIAGNVYLSSQTTPDGAAMAYVKAVGSNDSDAIWSRATVIAQPAQNSLVGLNPSANEPQLITKADLKAMLALPQNSHQPRTDISATVTAIQADTATVTVSYAEQGQRRGETLKLQRDRGQNQYLFYPNWRVVEAAGLIVVNVPSADSLVAIDGTSLPKGANSAIVLPGAHKLTLLPYGPFASIDQIATVQQGAYNQVALQYTTLVPAAQTAAAQTIKSYFTSCTQRTDAYSGDCPQRLDFYVNTPVHWQLVGDPSEGVKVSADPNSSSVVAMGHFLMTAELTTDSGTEHRMSGGPFVLGLAWDGQGFQIGSPGYYGAAPAALSNPGADQSAILDAVKAGWQTCLKATSMAPADCPARPYAYNPKSIKWSSATDAMAGAIVAWDQSVGAYRVTGNYSLVVNYTDGFEQAQENSITGQYTANVIWINQKAQLVNIG